MHPVFSGLTSDMERSPQRKVLIKALAVAFFVLLIFTLFGHQLLHLFGITLNAFRIAGGVIFFGIGLDMLQSKPRRWRRLPTGYWRGSELGPFAASTSILPITTDYIEIHI